MSSVYSGMIAGGHEAGTIFTIPYLICPDVIKNNFSGKVGDWSFLGKVPGYFPWLHCVPKCRRLTMQYQTDPRDIEVFLSG